MADLKLVKGEKTKKEEFEKYDPDDGALFGIIGMTITLIIIAIKAIKHPFGFFDEFPKVMLFMAFVCIGIMVNALGVMLVKRKRKIGSVIEIATYLALIALTYFMFI